MLTSPPAGRFLRVTAWTILLIGLFTCGASGQEKAPEKLIEADEAIELGTEEVSIPVTVRDRRTGNFVPNLTRKDFQLFEDGVEQQFSYFTAERVPVNVVLLIDTSSSVQAELENIKAAAWHFIHRLEPQDKFSIISFTDTVDLICDWTSEKPLARRALATLTTGKFTAFNDALFLTATEQLKGIKGRKAIIVLSDGVDNRASLTSTEAAFEAALRSEASVYVVSKTAILSRRMTEALNTYRRPDGSVNIPAEHQDYYSKLKRIVGTLQNSEDYLHRLAEETGGRIYLPLSLADLNTAYAQVADELKSQYLINYVPSNPRHDGKFRRVKVLVGATEFRAYSRGGYYAPRDETPAVTLRQP